MNKKQSKQQSFSVVVLTMESKSDLEAKLLLYKGQLAQVEELLLLDAENAQFVKLREDLNSVISLTTNLIQQVYNQPNNADKNASQGEDEKFSIKKQSVASSAKSGAIEVGENVEVTGGDRLYAGTVVEVVSDDEYKIKYFEFDAIVSLPASSLLRIDVNNPVSQQLEEYEVSVGLTCQSKYALDLNYYDCTVTGVTANGYNITYTAYGNSEEVPLQYLRATPQTGGSAFTGASSSGAGATSNRDANGNKRNADGLIPIPENLKILPTDTEEEKARKKKKIKAIKNKNRVVTIENEVKEVQQTWQKFVTKGSKRSLTGLAKSSIFQSSDAADGKLGVVNSGKGMTSFADRKKHKFEM